MSARIEDDGSREAAVAQIGEAAVHAAEVETVTRYAGRFPVEMFTGMGIPAAAIREGLAAAGVRE